MSILSFLLILLSECCSVAGQLLMKHAMVQSEENKAAFRRSFIIAIGCMAAGFFTWLHLMGKFELSFLYPFEGLNRILLVIGAIFFLKEKITPALWLGMILICAGVMLVSMTDPVPATP